LPANRRSEVAALEICPLADRPEALGIVSKWVHGEWGHKFGVSLEQMERGFRGRLHRDQIPFTLIGLLEGQPVGTSTVVSCDLPARRDLYPWLAAVYVHPEHRRNGYGAALVQAACALVATLGNEHLFLYTETAPAFYEKLGWRTLERRTYLGDVVSVMTLDLRRGSPTRKSRGPRTVSQGACHCPEGEIET
jgi:GNAT superfamily N-acetyltransferase